MAIVGHVAAVCCDLDGVLIRTMPLHAAAWLSAASRCGLSVSRRKIYTWEGESGLVTARRLLGRGAVGQGRPTSAQSVRRLLREKETRVTTLAKLIRVHAPWPGLLHTLVRRKIPLALVTGTSRAEIQRVVPRPILALFDVVITGDAVRHGKPHRVSPLARACAPDGGH